ncbi:MAG: hypothetical protein GY913_15825 [Proteobacteria bacterium]|nr:hypothetical protein [Pseudomonadota bacterium]
MQMSYDACGGTCQWATCRDGDWDCGSDACGAEHPHDACVEREPPVRPIGEGCYSRTLGQRVYDGDRVQMAYAACGAGPCRWAICNDGDWDCTANPARGDEYPHRSCR